MRILVSTAYQGHHQDWDLFEEAFEDQQVFEDQFDKLREYLNGIDGDVDSGGRIAKQVKEAILDLADGKRDRPWNLTLATNDSEDMDVFIKQVED